MKWFPLPPGFAPIVNRERNREMAENHPSGLRSPQDRSAHLARHGRENRRGNLDAWRSEELRNCQSAPSQRRTES